MRPVNLIPVEDRQGESKPLRTGPVAYIVLGALVLALAGVTMLVLADNKIADRKSELAQVKREDAAAKARAESLASYTQFAALHEERLQTIASLADSRFDWERVMREMALILPHSVWLTELDASAGGENSDASSADLSGSIVGPSLAIAGCAVGQESVAGFVTALKEIDGVTRVGVESSELAGEDEGAGSAGPEGNDSSDCRTRKFIAEFHLVVAFDAAPVPLSEGGGEAAPISPSEKSAAAAEEETGEKEETEGS